MIKIDCFYVNLKLINALNIFNIESCLVGLKSDGNLCIRPTMHRFRLFLINTANELGIENNERLADYQRDTKYYSASESMES